MSAFNIRPCDNKTCSICMKIITSEQSGGCLTVPSKRLKKLSKKTKSSFAFHWDENLKVNYVHIACYKSPPSLSSCESRLLSEVEESLEHFDTISTVRERIQDVIRLLKKSKHTVCFTGAGVSVSAGLPTYRGAEGIDTLSHFATSNSTSESEVVSSSHEEKDLSKRKREREDLPVDKDDDEPAVDYSLLSPTLTHRALVTLHEKGKMNYCITQNCDNLHQKAGFPREYLSDLHGNVFVEYCEKCLAEYTRDFSVDVFSTDCLKEPWAKKCKTCGWNHYTGRRCDSKQCNGKLLDTIVNFGDDLHSTVVGGLDRAQAHCEKADLCFCLGSSLTVTPANSLPTMAKGIVIVNLQSTELDDEATVRVYCTTDCFFHLLLEAFDE
eukprot:gene34189-44171_t